MTMRVVVVMKGKGELLQLIAALGSSGSFTRCLDGGQQQGHQYADDGDYNQQLYQCKTSSQAPNERQLFIRHCARIAASV
jgi:hypothetical protein